MDIGTKLSLTKEQLIKYKKRVVSTLFLCLLLLATACDFKKPEKWETPGLYTSMTISLMNNEFGFEGMVDDSLVFSDSVDVIRFEYPVDIDTLGIPDSYFDVDMSIVDIDIPDIPFIGDPIELPAFVIDRTISIPRELLLLEHLDQLSALESSFPDCFPKLSDIPLDLVFPLVEFDFPINYETGNSFFTIHQILLDGGSWNMEVTNNLPFAIDVELIVISGNNSIIQTGNDLNSITPGSTENYNESTPKTIDLDNELHFAIQLGTSTENTSCTVGSGEGWPYEAGGSGGVDIRFTVDNVLLGQVIVSWSELDTTISIGNKVPGFDQISIYRAKMDTAKADYPNKIILDMSSNFFIDVDFTLDMLNFFSSTEVNGATEWDTLTHTFTLNTDEEIDASNTEKGQIDLSNFTIAHGRPDITSPQPIDSILINLHINIPAANNQTIDVPEDHVIRKTGPKLNSLTIENMGIVYIEALTHNLTFSDLSSAPIGGIPTGFTDIEFVDLRLGIDVTNEIAIPAGFQVDIVGSKDNDSWKMPVQVDAIAIPYEDSYGCSFPEIGGNARTNMLLTKESLRAEYFCSDSAADYNDFNENLFPADQSNIVELVNVVPEQITISGAVTIDGEGRLAKGSDIWGNLNLIAPLSLIFKRDILILPDEYTTMEPMTASEAARLKEQLIEATLYTKIINKSSVGGSLSILISDNTIFPLFLDSLSTGRWEDQKDEDGNVFDDEIWSHLSASDPVIDSINIIPVDLSIENSRALEVQFYHDSELQFFIGKLVDSLAFNASDTTEYRTGFYLIENTNETIIEMNNTRMEWMMSTEPRYITPYIKLQGSPRLDSYEQHSTETDSLNPFTLQTTNAIDVQSFVTFTLDTEGF